MYRKTWWARRSRMYGRVKYLTNTHATKEKLQTKPKQPTWPLPRSGPTMELRSILLARASTTAERFPTKLSLVSTLKEFCSWDPRIRFLSSPSFFCFPSSLLGLCSSLVKTQELISTHPFTEICSWASSSTTFAFEFGVQTEATKYTFETKQVTRCRSSSSLDV